ncbi:hypothetical protein, partial [Clostridium tarantellae]|uniref:hypothetical protein n=1 Tax=Clostridium tarantellae TaxID=39493 RepID=UPI001A9AE8B8
CRYFFKCSNKRNLPSVELLIQQNILPVRKGRQDRRKLRAQSPVFVKKIVVCFDLESKNFNINCINQS